MSKRIEGGFNAILRYSIHQGIESVVGSSTAKAIEFYLDSSIAGKDIETYTKALEKMFDLGAKMIEDRCAEALYANLKLANFQRRDKYSLTDYVIEAKRLWLLGENNQV